MQIQEIASDDSQRLLGLIEFLIGRAGDVDAKKKISVQALVNMANNLGMSINSSSLIRMAQKEPLSNLIKNINNDEVIFVGGPDNQPAAAPTTPADSQKTVEKMARRAMK